MPSDRQTRRQRHQAAIKPQRGKAIRGAQATEFVKNSGFRKSEFIGGKKYYTSMSTDPNSSGAGGNVTNITLSGSSSPSNVVDNVGVFRIQTALPVTGGHVTPITESGVISIEDYDPIGAAASGLSSKGVVGSDTVYDGGSPGTFATHFLRKDGVWADVSASLDSFKTWSWVPQSGTPFTTVADSSADTITVTAGSNIEFTDGSSGSTDAITLSVPTGTASALGAVRVVGGNALGASYSSGVVTINHDDTSSVSNIDSSGVTFVQDLTFDTYGHVTGRASAAVPEYDPIGGDHTGLATTGHTYDGGNPTANNFTTHFLRKDGVFANPAASVLAFKILSWVPSSGSPFVTTADATDDTLTITAGTGINVSLNSDDNVTITNTVTDTNTHRGIDDTPVDGQTSESITSNWAYDHAANASAHHSRYTNAEAVSAQPDYDPVGGAHSGVVQTSDTYSGGNPSANNFTTYFLRKDGGWANPLGSVNAFKTLSWAPSGGGTPFTTIADATDDTLTVTAGTGIQVALTAADHVTITSTVTDTNTQCGGDGHARYANSEAVAAVNATSSITTTCDSPDVNHNTDVNWNCSSISGSAGTARTTLGIDTDDAVTFGALTCSTLNTGQGATEVHLMNQHVKTDSDVRFDSFGVGTDASSTTGEIRATNEVTAYYSDDRLKTKYGNIEKALEKVCSLNGFHYSPNDLAGSLGYNTDDKKVGVSAQEVLKVLPEAVTSAPIDSQYHAVQYDKLIPLMIEAIKELSERKCSCGV